MKRPYLTQYERQRIIHEVNGYDILVLKLAWRKFIRSVFGSEVKRNSEIINDFNRLNRSIGMPELKYHPRSECIFTASPKAKDNRTPGERYIDLQIAIEVEMLDNKRMSENGKQASKAGEDLRNMFMKTKVSINISAKYYNRFKNEADLIEDLEKLKGIKISDYEITKLFNGYWISGTLKKESGFDFLDTEEYKEKKQKAANDILYSKQFKEEFDRLENLNKIIENSPRADEIKRLVKSAIELGKCTKPKTKNMKQHIYFNEENQELLSPQSYMVKDPYVGYLKSKVVNRIQKLLDEYSTPHATLMTMLRDGYFNKNSEPIGDLFDKIKFDISKTPLHDKGNYDSIWKFENEKDTEYKPTKIHLFIKPGEISKMLDNLESHCAFFCFEKEENDFVLKAGDAPKPKLEDKMLVWAWDNEWSHNRELLFYDAINKCAFMFDGKRGGDEFSNYKPFKGDYPKWARKAYETLED